MDNSTDPLARQLAVTALTTEHFNLQSARMGTITEANGRATLYLGTLSSSVIAIAFVGQANQLGDAFYLFALTLLPPVFLLGVFSFLRLVQTSIEDMVYALGSFRIRQYFLDLDPAVAPYFPPTDPQGMTKLERIGVVAGGPLAAGGTGPGGGGDRRGGGAGAGDPVRPLPGPPLPAGGGGRPGAVRGPEPEHAGMDRARGQLGTLAAWPGTLAFPCFREPGVPDAHGASGPIHRLPRWSDPGCGRP
jgi:hypothetical protein